MKNTLVFLLLITSFLLNGQVGINNTTPNATLDINSSTEANKGVLVPRLSSQDIKDIVSPPLGLIVYDTTKRCLMVYNGETLEVNNQLVPDWSCVSALTSGSVDGNGNPGKLYAKTRRTYGGADYDAAIAAYQNSNGNFVLFGDSESIDYDIKNHIRIRDIWVVGTDPNNGNIVWEKTYGDNLTDKLKYVFKTNDGGYYLVGETKPYVDATTNDSNTPYSVIVKKIDASGNELWSKTVEGNKNEEIKQAFLTNDGGLVIGGTTYSNSGDLTHSITNSTNDRNIFVVKINTSGTLQWANVLGGGVGTEYNAEGDDDFGNIIKTSDNGVLFLGHSPSTTGDLAGDGTIQTYNGIGNFTRVLIVKMSSSGVKQWVKLLGTSDMYDRGLDVVEDSAGNYLLHTSANNKETSTLYFYYLVSINSSDGSVLSTSTASALTGVDKMSIVTHERIIDLDSIQNSSNMYMFTRAENAFYTGYKGAIDLGYIKFSTTDATETKTFGGSGDDIINNYIKTADGGYVLVGSTTSFDGDLTENKGETDGWIIKLDSSFQKVWSKSFGGTNEDVFTNVSMTSDGKFLVSGYTNSLNGDVRSRVTPLGTEFWTMLIDSNGNVAYND